MTDIVDQKIRSRMMAGIKGKNTKPELVLRRALHALGLRFRLHDRKIKGIPDLAFPKFNAVVFVHGCFWHRHAGCLYATTPSTRPEFWQSKFATNVARDDTVKNALLESGWRVAIVWECALRKPQQVEVTANHVADWLSGSSPELQIGAG